MSSYSSLASPYVRSAFLNGMMGSACLRNGVPAFPNIYPSFPNKPSGSVRHGGPGEKQHHRHHDNGYSEHQFGASH
jgi:hypothetical protein